MNKILLLFFVWLGATSVLTFLVPMQDVRYAAVPFLPFILFSCTCLGIYFSKITHQRKGKLFFFVSILVMNICISATSSLLNSYSFGNFMIALDEEHTFIEHNYKNGAVNFPSEDTAYFPLVPSLSNNTYVAVGDRSYFITNFSASNTLLYFRFNSPPKKNDSKDIQLEATFTKGPHCFMLYKIVQEEMNTTQFIEFQHIKKDTHDTFVYVFQKPTTLSYCTVRIYSKFMMQNWMNITIVGEENITQQVIRLPLGKHTICEHLCPTLNSTNIKHIEVSVPKHYLNNIVGVRGIVREA